ncbi:unnamed protein product [Gadus morhua 'NCC']
MQEGSYLPEPLPLHLQRSFERSPFHLHSLLSTGLSSSSDILGTHGAGLSSLRSQGNHLLSCPLNPNAVKVSPAETKDMPLHRAEAELSPDGTKQASTSASPLRNEGDLIA